MQGREATREKRAVSLERISTVLFQRLVPMTSHSASLRRISLTASAAVFSISRTYFGLTGRSVESTLMP